MYFQDHTSYIISWDNPCSPNPSQHPNYIKWKISSSLLSPRKTYSFLIVFITHRCRDLKLAYSETIKMTIFRSRRTEKISKKEDDYESAVRFLKEFHRKDSIRAPFSLHVVSEEKEFDEPLSRSKFRRAPTSTCLLSLRDSELAPEENHENGDYFKASSEEPRQIQAKITFRSK
mmetsp:Transcript_7544/g.11511  ORF Transcript_7544/g.11511 Transcript_7544/m.11511 type:complete len:174 (-) Transcript_7544:80-601(-)